MKFAIFYLKNTVEALKSDIVHILLAFFDVAYLKAFYFCKCFLQIGITKILSIALKFLAADFSLKWIKIVIFRAKLNAINIPKC